MSGRHSTVLSWGVQSESFHLKNYVSNCYSCSNNLRNMKWVIEAMMSADKLRMTQEWTPPSHTNLIRATPSYVTSVQALPKELLISARNRFGREQLLQTRSSGGRSCNTETGRAEENREERSRQYCQKTSLLNWGHDQALNPAIKALIAS